MQIQYDFEFMRNLVSDLSHGPAQHGSRSSFKNCLPLKYSVPDCGILKMPLLLEEFPIPTCTLPKRKSFLFCDVAEETLRPPVLSQARSTSRHATAHENTWPCSRSALIDLVQIVAPAEGTSISMTQISFTSLPLHSVISDDDLCVKH